MKPTAKKLILGLLLAREGQPLSAREAVAACALFGISGNSVRVTLARLCADELLQSRDRGSYVFGPAARNLAAQVAAWHSAEQRLQPWQGDYVVASVSMLGRTDRRALRRRERALELLGMRELERGLFLRPDNLAGGADTVRERLLALGLEPEALVFTASNFEKHRQAAIRKLWDRATLERRYEVERQRLLDWLNACDQLDRDTAARESYLLGGNAIRLLVYDPWLPEEMIDADARHRFAQAVERFDAAGKAIWNARSLDETTSSAEAGVTPFVPVNPAMQALS